MSISISYQLNPPPGVPVGSLPTSKTQKFPVNSSPEDYAKFYRALHGAIEEAKDQLGNELTTWRDVVGKAELSKETQKTLKYAVDDEDENEQS